MKEKAGKTVRFRVASANSGRVLAEVFKDEKTWCSSVSDSADSDGTDSMEAEQGSLPPASEANRHLNGLEAAVDENGCESDDLLLYASVKREMMFSNKRINICSKNGTIRGVRNKVSAGSSSEKKTLGKGVMVHTDLSQSGSVSMRLDFPFKSRIYATTSHLPQSGSQHRGQRTHVPSPPLHSGSRAGPEGQGTIRS
ncbi:hypothetical protein CCH79_00004720 [Gambusia affinis]|uniref:Glutaredoxin and cysteine rich domain containing 1 b n=1 Tax=Gambusia affinis TaxID=33528 RepID=A0A315UXH9_GAMAF|nr:hypothetical protein CCH79_00004720 [Gambusia affinis]